ncbi:AI-2E family transporter [Streptomyces sp. ME02-8801-2C]|uniref:AI-2E family transporter n=1 Tax=Streptomyces sp. ME02-8801-2C TaxID=3028680 RepID=UPI0029B000B5|nr:AI-2E family transporter [Streptomyces sp. ME02-8801-2C]MDX3456971.1 AI-2E family transporter [Streptomyces sp. ME02-8801-2C]
MSRVPHWLGRAGARLTEMGQRLDARRAEVEKEHTDVAHDMHDVNVTDDVHLPHGTEPARQQPGISPIATSPETSPATSAAPSPTPSSPPDHGSERERSPAAATTTTLTGPGAVAVRPEPASVVPWGVRVAAEAGWRLLVLAGTVWVLMRVISAVQLVVFAFVVSLLITALLQPTVARLTRWGMPRGPATALTAILGFVVMGLIGWFVTWQVMENIDNLADQIQDGIDELRNWLLKSPFHVTDKQINEIAENLRDAVGANTDEITSAGLEGVTVIVEGLTGILLAAFSTLFLLYDGKRIWQWTLKLVPAAARPGVAGAGPRAWRTLTAYVRGTVIVALIDAIFIGLGIYFLDVPMAVPLAVFIFLFSFIPLVGAVASGALAVVVALVTQGVLTAVLVLAVVLAVQQIEGHILQPFILGRAVRVHPLAVVLSVAAGGMVAGIGGAVVAVPLVAVTNTVVGYLRAYSQAHTQETASLRHAPPPRGATSAEIALTKSQQRAEPTDAPKGP